MLKYLNTEVTFSEIPDEITLCINITGCKNACEGCHSPYLAEDIGTELTIDVLANLIKTNKGITCVCFMGGDTNPKDVEQLAIWMKLQSWFRLKTAWYSGRQYIPDEIDVANFNYIKIGPYVPKLGGLDKDTTNQIMYEVCRTSKLGNTYMLKEITHKFRKHED